MWPATADSYAYAHVLPHRALAMAAGLPLGTALAQNHAWNLLRQDSHAFTWAVTTAVKWSSGALRLRCTSKSASACGLVQHIAARLPHKIASHGLS